MKHTPGPWHTVTGSAIHAADGRWVATAHGNTSQQRMANNRLIAAAPDMLAMLKELEFCTGQFFTRCFFCEYHESEGHTDDCKLGKLLVKIKGEK